MMQGLNVDINPIEQAISQEPALEILYEDDFLLLVNKPHEFLSVPGKTISNSVLTKMQAYLPNASGPLLLHRLDMSTSGLLLVAKSVRIHKQLQKQFIERSIKKRYVALLDGVIPNTEGTINLPLRVDLDNRPQQLVCYQYGKQAITKYKVITTENGVTRIHFYPVTGRTHQLRVHAAHTQGLKTPIVGDDLYGTKAKHLYLHAESLTFTHPITKKILTITCNAPF
jgi:tRNA pseudouridine32 synthase/23S rRNA pseudouridine746 synthase